MKFLRNPWVTGALGAVAVAVVLYQVLAPHWQRGASAAGQPSAPLAAAPASVPPARPAVGQGQAESNSRPSALGSPAVAGTNAAEPARIDRAYAELHFAGWVNAPKRDPFLLLGGETHGQEKANAETNSPLLHWKLKAIWNQTGSRLAVINHAVYREGDEIEGYKIARIEGEEVWFQGPRRMERLGFEKRGPAAVTAPAAVGSNPQPSGSRESQPPGSRS